MGAYKVGTMGDAWDVLCLALPQDWRKLAQETGASRGLRKDPSVDNLLRTLLLHLGCGHSLQEMVRRKRPLAEMPYLSDVALLKRARKSKAWLHALCVRLFEEQRMAVLPEGAAQVRAVDAATVKERGPSGSLWRVHYSVSLPSLACDFFKLTATEGLGTEKSLARFPIHDGDHVLAGRGYATTRGIRHVANAGGRLIVPVDTGSLPLSTATGQPFDLPAEVTLVTRAGDVRATTVVVPGDDGGPPDEIAGRFCVRRKSPEAIRLAQEQVRGDPAREGNQVQPATLRFAEYEIVFTTLPDPLFSAADVLDWYRLRQQVELVFENFSVLAQLGHLPKSDDSAMAWFYTKLMTALLVEKLIRAISPSDNVPARRSEQRQFVFEAVRNAIEPPLVQVRRAQHPLTRGELRRRVRASSRNEAPRRFPHGTPAPTWRHFYQDQLERLESLVSRCA